MKGTLAVHPLLYLLSNGEVMKNRNLKISLAMVALSLTCNALAASTLIQNVRVFDGEKMQAARHVLFDDGKIIDANFKGKVQADMRLIDGRGRTLLPGLIDAHVHAFQHQELPLLFGVTTQIDMFTGVGLMQEMNKRQQQGENKHAADLIAAGVLATAPGGHGTQYGMPIPTLTTPAEAQAWVDARIAEGSHFIKIVMESGSEKHVLASLDLPTVKALIQASHARNKLAVVHISTLRDAHAALSAGADGLVHLFRGEAIEPGELNELVALAKKQRAFVIPTLSVLESMAGLKAQDLLDDAAFTALLNKAQLQSLQTTYGKQANDKLLVAPKKMIAALQAAKVPVLAGTDAGNSGTQYGISLHHELSSLVQAGLQPIQALTAATKASAQAFRLRDRGQIASGFKADLLLVEGDPSLDITATRRIVEVWKDGESASPLRDKQAKLVAEQKQSHRPSVKLPTDGRISLFSKEKLASPFGFGWHATNDAPMGGKSTVELKLLENALEGLAALQVTAKINPGFAYPWAGLVFFPAAQPMQAANLSAANTLKFRVKGDGQSYNVGFTAEGSFIPMNVAFVAGSEWREISLPFTQFKGLDPSIITMLTFSAGPVGGDYQFQVADIRLLTEKTPE